MGERQPARRLTPKLGRSERVLDELTGWGEWEEGHLAPWLAGWPGIQGRKVGQRRKPLLTASKLFDTLCLIEQWKGEEIEAAAERARG